MLAPERWTIWLYTFATARAASSLPARTSFCSKTTKASGSCPRASSATGATREIALYRVEAEAGIRAEIVAFVGRTCYDFFSRSRRREVSNRIQWFAMRAPDRRYRVAFEQGFLDGGYYPCEAAMRLLTHEQDREILRRAREIVAAPAADG